MICFHRLLMKHIQQLSRLTMACAFLSLLFVSVGVRSALAHERVELGPYVVVVGWVKEPAIVGERNALFLQITEDGEPVKKGTVIGKLFSEIGPRYLDRSGGYTRIIRLSQRRLGDNGKLVLLQLVGEDETPTPKEKVTAAKEKVEQPEDVVEAEPVEETEEAEQSAAAPEDKEQTQ